MPVTPDGIQLLTDNSDWLAGFACGTIVTALAQHCPFVSGLVRSKDDEQAIVFGARYGYTVERKIYDQEFTQVTFRLREDLIER